MSKLTALEGVFPTENKFKKLEKLMKIVIEMAVDTLFQNGPITIDHLTRHS